MTARQFTRNKGKDNNPFGGMVKMKMAGIIFPGTILGGIYLSVSAVVGSVLA